MRGMELPGVGAWCPCTTTVGVSWCSVQGDTEPWGCRCAHVGAPQGLGSSGCGDSSSGGGVQAGWGWVTVISCPQAAAVVSCWCRGEGAGEQARLPGGCWAPPGAGMVAVVCLSPRVFAGQSWGGCSRGDAWQVLGGSLFMGVWESGLCTVVGCPFCAGVLVELRSLQSCQTSLPVQLTPFSPGQVMDGNER